MARASRMILALLWSCIGVLLSLGGVARAQDFYQGRTINFVISYPGGGSYDIYSRMIAAHIGRFLPGNPTVVPQLMPGGGGIRATNYLYNVAPKDGTAIGMLDQAIYLYQVLGLPELKADATKFNWIGRIAPNTAVLFARSDAAVQKIADAFTTEIIVATPGSASRLNWALLNDVVGTKIKMISGYKTAAEARLAVARGEVQGLSMPWPEIKLQSADWLAKKEINLLLQTSLQRHPELPDVPRMVDLAKSEDDRLILTLFSLSNSVGRSVVAPPDLPAERVAALRQAFSQAIADPALREEAERVKMELDPMTGADLQAMLLSNRDFPPAVVERAKRIAEAKE